MKTLILLSGLTLAFMSCNDGNMNNTPNDGFRGTPPTDTMGANRNNTHDHNTTRTNPGSGMGTGIDDRSMNDTTRRDNTGSGTGNQ